MNCSKVKENLSPYLDNMLSEEEKKAVETHLASCPECQQELEDLQQTIAMLSSLEEIIPPASFRRELREKLEKEVDNKQKKSFSINGLISKWFGNLKTSAAVPVAISLILLIVIMPSFFRMGSPLSKSADEAAESAPETRSFSIADSGFTNDSIKPQEELKQEMALEGDKAGDMNFTANGGAMKQKAASLAGNSARVVERKIIKNADVTLQVDDYASAVDLIKQQVHNLGGYVANESVRMSHSSNVTSGHLQVKIPQQDFESFLSGIDGVGKIKYRNIYTDDVTEEYVDVQSRLNALRTKEERLLNILTKAGKLSEILEVENELASTRAQLESLQGRLRYLNNRVDFSNIEIDVEQVVTSTQQISATGLKGVWLRTQEAFIKTINNILYGIGKFIEFLGAALPYLVLLLIAGYGGFRYYKKWERRNK